MAWPAIAAGEYDADSPITTNWGADVVDRTDMLRGTKQYVRKTATTTKTNDAVMADDPHLKFWLDAYEKWFFWIYLSITTTNNVVDLDWFIAGPAACNWRAWYTFYDIAGATPVFANGGGGTVADGGADVHIDYQNLQTSAPGFIYGWMENDINAEYMHLLWAQNVGQPAQSTSILTESALVAVMDPQSF